jgi:hypothetical protein
MLTKKYYKKIAEIIKNTKKIGNSLILDDFVNKLTEYLYEDNPNFDCERFIDACGLKRLK